MTDLQILESYRATCLEMDAIRQQIQRMEISGKPHGMSSQDTSGIGRSTNDKTAAAIQTLDGLEAALEERMQILQKIVARFEKIVASVQMPMGRVVLRRYYGMGETDAQVAAAMGYSERRVNQIRNTAIRHL